MEANTNPTHTATIEDLVTGEFTVVNCYAIPAGLTAEEFDAFISALVAKVVA
jgi:hypothetical protein